MQDMWNSWPTPWQGRRARFRNTSSKHLSTTCSTECRGFSLAQEGDENLVLEHEHVEVDLFGVLRHGHEQYGVLPVHGRSPRRRCVIGVVNDAALSIMSRRGELPVKQQRHVSVLRRQLSANLLPVALRRQLRA
jgi:hypothetical protein